MSESEIQYKSQIVLLLLRCEYISGPKLTKKGRGWFGPKFWRAYGKIMCAVSKKHRAATIEILDSLAEKQAEGFRPNLN